MAPACLFLAGKVEENPRRIRELLGAALAVRFGTEEELPLGAGGEGEERLKAKLLAKEQLLLECLGFKYLLVSHPYPHIEMLVRSRIAPGTPWLDGFVRACLQIASDAQRLPLCLRYPPEAIAEAIVGYEGRRREAEHPELGRLVRLDTSTLRAIVRQLEDLYAARNKKH